MNNEKVNEVSEVKVNFLYEIASEIIYAIDDYKKVSRLNDNVMSNLRAYINTCVTIGSLPYRQTIFEGIDISQYEVIDAIPCLSNFVVRVNAVNGEDESEVNHVSEIVAYSGAKFKEVVTNTLPVEQFNRITAALSGALKCGITTISRKRLSIAEASRLSYHTSTGWVFGDTTYAPFGLDIAILDEFATDAYQDFKKKFLIAMGHNIRGSQGSGKKDSSAE